MKEIIITKQNIQDIKLIPRTIIRNFHKYIRQYRYFSNYVLLQHFIWLYMYNIILQLMKDEETDQLKIKDKLTDVLLQNKNTFDQIIDIFSKQTVTEIADGNQEEDNGIVQPQSMKCDSLNNSIVSLKGLSRGASVSDIWLITFKNYITKYGICKVYFNLNSIRRSLFFDKDRFEIVTYATKGLHYEYEVYDKVTNPLIDHEICTHFVKKLANIRNCSFQNILNLVKGKFIKKSSNEEEQITLNFALMLNNYYKKVHGKRKSISKPMIQNISFTDIEFEAKYQKKTLENMINVKNMKYDYFITKFIKNQYSFSDFIYNHMNKLIPNKEFFNVLFQVMYTCYCMTLRKMVHNDLHSGNVIVEIFTKPKYMSYIIHNKLYVIYTQYNAHVLDYDRCYVQSLGKNPYLDETIGFCESYSQCNQIIENKDMLKIVCGIFAKKNIDLLKHVTTQKNKNFVAAAFKIGCHFYEDKKGKEHHKALSKSFFNKCFDPFKILSNIMTEIKFIEKKKALSLFVQNKTKLNICSPKFFDKIGNIVPNFGNIKNDIVADVRQGGVKKMKKMSKLIPHSKISQSSFDD